MDTAREQGFQIIEEAFALYPNHEEVRIEFAKGSAFHKAAYKRLQLCQDFDILATVFLPFYRATWKRILQEGNMAQEIVEVTRLLTIHLPSQTKSELWDYAYYAHLCKLTKEAEQVYIRYL